MVENKYRGRRCYGIRNCKSYYYRSVGGGVSTTVIVSYNSTTETYSYNSSTITFKVPSNISYTISFADIDEYKTPDPITRISALNNSISFTVIYNEKPLSVGIVDTDGNVIKVSDWTGGSNCTGIALINDNVSLIIAPDEWCTYEYNTSEADPAWNGNSCSAWGGDGTTVTGIKTTTDSSDAITDFAGSSNTDAIISQLKGIDDGNDLYTGAPAAEYCRAYSKGYKGVGQWYLPSLGEYNQIIQNATDINTAIAKVSGESLDAYYNVWTSTQASASRAWCYDWRTESIYSIYKVGGYGVRPICSFDSRESTIVVCNLSGSTSF